MSATETILSLEHLSVRLPRGADRTHALKDVSLEIASNEILCVVGESGSGKSMMANAVMRLLPNEVTIDNGRMLFEGRDLCAATVAQMREVRGAGIAMIFQEPMTALNPLRTIGDQIGEMFSIHTDLSKAEINARVLALLADVRIPDPKVAAKAYPHELSGGQRQRAFEQDRDRHHDAGVDDDRRQCVGKDFTEDELNILHAQRAAGLHEFAVAQ